MKRVVFVADDFGMSRGTNRGIERAVEAGLVREVSVMATGAALDDAADRLRSLDVGCGLHLCLTAGSAKTGAIRGLTDATGRFLPMPRVLGNAFAGRVRRDDVRVEIEAQLDELGSRQIAVEHLDGHHHVHVFPVIRDAVLAVARSRGIAQLRVPREKARPTLRMWVLSRLSDGFERRLRREVPRRTNIPVVGLDLVGVSDHAKAFAELARRLPPAAEWVVHPREVDEELEHLDPPRLGARRATEDELRTLTDPATRELLSDLGVRLCRFKELASDDASGARSGGD